MEQELDKTIETHTFNTQRQMKCACKGGKV